MSKIKITFTQAEDEFKKIIDVPIGNKFHSVGTYLFFDLGEMHSWRMKNDKTGKVFESEEGDYILEFGGTWFLQDKMGNTLRPAELFKKNKSYEQVGEQIDQYLLSWHPKRIIQVLVDEQKKLMKFVFNDKTLIEASADSVGLVDLYNKIDGYVIHFDPIEQLFNRENLISK